MINSLQSFRGIFAICVLLSHYIIPHTHDRGFYPGGASGVVYFLILSGFVMCAAYASKISAEDFNYRSYISKRFIRVMPLNWLALLAAVLIAVHWHFKFHADSAWLNIFSLQAWYPFNNRYYGMNVPSWCLAPIILFYLLFPFMYRKLKGSPRKFMAGFAIFVGVLLIGYSFLPDDQQWQTWTVRVFPPFRLVEFTIGMMLFELYTILHNKNFTSRLLNLSFATKTAIEAAAIGVWLGFLWIYYQLDERWLSSVVWWLPTTLLVITFALLDSKGGFITRILHFRPLVYLGEVSFCIYLTHTICFSFLQQMSVKYRFFPPHPTHLFLVLIFCIFIGILVYELFDKPLSRFLRKRITNFSFSKQKKITA